MTAHFVTMGGGGFGMSEDRKTATSLDRHLLELTGKASPLVCFAPTAAADASQYINRFLVAFGAIGVRTMILTLWDDSRRSVARLPEADLLYVGGGHTVNLLALWQAHGVSDAVRRLAEREDMVIAGVAAGANAFFEGFSTDSFGGNDPYRGGLGLLPGSFCPHFDGEAQRAPLFAQWVADGVLPSGWGADDGAAICWRDGAPTEFIAERRYARVHRVAESTNPGGSGVLVEPHEMRVL